MASTKKDTQTVKQAKNNNGNKNANTTNNPVSANLEERIDRIGVQLGHKWTQKLVAIAFQQIRANLSSGEIGEVGTDFANTLEAELLEAADDELKLISSTKDNPNFFLPGEPYAQLPGK